MALSLARAVPGSFTPTSFIPLNVFADSKQPPGVPTPRSVSPSSMPPLAATPPLPMSRAEMKQRGWDEVDVVFVSGDAYVDHPSFATAILARVLEATGFRVGIIAQPPWHNCEAWREFGRPRLFFAISAGNMDSMINHYTANKKVRNDDAYSPGGRIGLRPDRATLVYCQRAREAYKGVPIIAGGVEASLRRLAHYDYWSDTVKRSILLDSKADLVVFGMGESAIVEIAQRLRQELSSPNSSSTSPYAAVPSAGVPGAGVMGATAVSAVSHRRSPEGAEECSHGWSEAEPVGASTPATTRPEGAEEPFNPNTPRLKSSSTFHSLRDMRGIAYVLGAKESQVFAAGDDFVMLPSFEQVRSHKHDFAEATRVIHMETNPYNARTLVQWHDRQLVVCNPPRLPESREAMDFYYGLPFTRKPHPSYTESIPAFEMIKDSVTIMRGCFGGCTYCSITTHQGRIIQSRSKESIVGELNRMAADREFKGVVSDIGGPTANMFEMRCVRPEIEAICRRLSCVHPKICPLLGTDHGPLLEVMRAARGQKGIRKVLVASGVRMDLARMSPEYMHELTAHHVGGHLKVAQEHTDAETLGLMKRPAPSTFEDFGEQFRAESKKAGKKQFLIPYFISAHPGTDLNAMIDLAVFLKQQGYRPEQVQDFIPAPFDIAACMYHTGLDPITKKPVKVATSLRDRKQQRALMQFFKPENYFAVRKALLEAGRRDLIGNGCNCLIPSQPPKAAFEARMRGAHRAAGFSPRDGSEATERRSDDASKGESSKSRKADTTKQKDDRDSSIGEPGAIDSRAEDHVHSPRRYVGPGYRPKRPTARRRERGSQFDRS